jgi:VWFA-related protein
MRGRCGYRAMLMFVAGVAAWGQEEPTFTAGVKVVNLLATVQTKKGEIVRDLGRDDFLVAENGHPQKIQYFSKESDLPLTLGLLIDTSMSQERVMEAERGASFRFLDSVLREKLDQVFIMTFDVGTWLRLGLTGSRKELEDALAFVDTPTRRELQAIGGGTALYDAVQKASVEIMRERQGRKALIVLSDGEDVNSRTPLEQAIDSALRAETLIYSIYFTDASRSLGTGRGVLARMSRETGGGFFEVTKKLSIGQVFSLIEEELRSQYSIGYVSDQPVRAPEFRKVQLSTKQKGLVVQSRDRYWAVR